MRIKGTPFEIFPRDNPIRLQDAFIYLMTLGFFGAHQFYLENKKKAFLILGLTSISNILILFSPFIYPYILPLVGKYIFAIFGIGYLMALPILAYDFTTLHIQVRKKNGVVVI